MPIQNPQNLNQTIAQIGADIKELKEQTRVSQALQAFSSAIEAAQINNVNVGNIDIFSAEIDTSQQPPNTSHTYHINLPEKFHGKQGVFILMRSADGINFYESAYQLRKFQFGERLSFSNTPSWNFRKTKVICLSASPNLERAEPDVRQGYPSPA